MIQGLGSANNYCIIKGPQNNKVSVQLTEFNILSSSFEDNKLITGPCLASLWGLNVLWGWTTWDNVSKSVTSKQKQLCGIYPSSILPFLPLYPCQVMAYRRTQFIHRVSSHLCSSYCATSPQLLWKKVCGSSSLMKTREQEMLQHQTQGWLLLCGTLPGCMDKRRFDWSRGEVNMLQQ